MESSEHNAFSTALEDGGRRSRAGRVSRAPARFSPEPTAPSVAGKRKRHGEHDDEDLENESPLSDAELSDIDVDVDGDVDGDGDVDDADADEGDDTIVAHASKKKRPLPSNRSKKPAAKKPKINGTGPSHAASLPSRPKKNTRVVEVNHDANDLYTDVFTSGDLSDDVASRWYGRYREDIFSAVADLVNCVLLAAGCEQLVTADDTADPDNCERRIAELQSLCEDAKMTEYPLVARTKSSRSFRSLLVDFFKSLINVLHETQTLYQDGPLIENIFRWVASMSSSTHRPFRHTACTVALAMEGALVQVAKKLDERVTKTTQQIEGERSRPGHGQRRDNKLASIEAALEEAEQYRAMVGEQMGDIFNTVFIHRYRDVEAKIRAECMEALGLWVSVLPDTYMQPEYLRYFGWQLCDANGPTRHEVLKQLTRPFKRGAEKLGSFIDRFRPRLVEMAIKDVDVNGRIAAIVVIDALRDSAMLEPDDVDAVGRLIFDSDVRIRKAIVDFFVGGVNDLVETKVEEIGGDDALDEILDEDQEDYNSPRREWIHVKCIAESLSAYDAQDAAEEAEEESATIGIEYATEVVSTAGQDGRITIAAQVLYDKLPEVSNWEIIAGYLLFDHTVSTRPKTKSKSRAAEAAFRAAVMPQGDEEAVLLEVLAAAVKLAISGQGVTNDPERHKKKSGRGVDGDAQDATAVRLADLIPRLLRKYGADASTATTVLRLHHYLDLEVFQQLRQDSTTYPRLLDEICTQFSRHGDKEVIAEATQCLLEARRHEDLQELVGRKLEDLWQQAVTALRNIEVTTQVSVRGNLSADSLRHLANVLAKISKLASISDCTDVLEAEGEFVASPGSAIAILADMVQRGRLGEINDDIDNLEDEVTVYAIKCCHFYFSWKFLALRAAVQRGVDIPGSEIDRVSFLRRSYENNLIHTFSSRGGFDELRLFSTGHLCDLQYLCGTLWQLAQESGASATKYAGLKVLAVETEPGLVPELIAVYDTAERLYAKRARKTLGEPALDDDPLEEDMLSDDENDADLKRSTNGRKAAEVRAEKNLCDVAGKMVRMVRARMVDQSGPRAGQLRRRLLRNQHRLGQSLKNILAYLDESMDWEEQQQGAAGAFGARKRQHPLQQQQHQQPLSAKARGKLPEGASAVAAVGAAGRGLGKQPLSEEIIVADDVFDGGEEDEPEEGTVEDLRRRELLDDGDLLGEEDDDDSDAAGGGGGAGAAGGGDDDSILGD